MKKLWQKQLEIYLLIVENLINQEIFEEKVVDDSTGITTYTFTFKKNAETYKVKYDKDGYPIFNSKYETSLSESYHIEPDSVQLKYLSQKL